MRGAIVILALAAGAIHGAEARADSNLTLAGTLAPGEPSSIEIRGDLAYVAAGRRFNILDIGDPQSISLVSSTPLTGVSSELVVNGDLVYLMEGAAGISIYGVTSPEAPVRLGGTATSGTALAGELFGNLLFIAAGDGGLLVVDVYNPGAPAQLGSSTFPGYTIEDVAIDGSMAYLMAIRPEWDLFFPTLMAVSLGNPVSPTLVASHEYLPQAFGGSILVHDSVIYLTDGYSTVYSAEYATLSGIVPLGELACPAAAITVDANGDLFAADYREFASVDISQPDAMALISTIPTPGWGGGFNIDGARTLLPQGDRGAVLLDVTNPQQMLELTHWFPPGDANGLTYRDGLLFVAGEQTWVIDAADPASMKSLAANGTGIWDWVTQPTDHGVAYAAGSGIRAIDVGTGSTLGSVRPDGQTLDVSFWNDTVYSAQSASGFAILDFSDPTQPQQVGGFTGHTIRKLAAGHDVLYTAGAGLIEAFDVTDPTAPVSTFSTPYTDFIGDVVVEGGRLFVCEGTGGVHIFGLGDPLFPKHLGTLPAQTRTYDVAVRGRMMAVAEPDHGAFLYDLEDPSSPLLVGSCSRPGRIDEVVLSDHTLFLNVDGEGVYAYAIDDVVTAAPAPSGSAAFLRIAENPARNVARFSFGTPWPDEVELTVYDLAGRRVSRFRRSTRPGEPSWIVWNGRDASNRSVASGVYVVRLTTSRSTLTDKITFMR
jgi:hypothetical protein